MRQLPVKAGIACGLIGLVVFLILYPIAIVLDGNYVFFENYLSDLGVGHGAWAFNSALVMTGIMLVVFACFGIGAVMGDLLSAKAGKIFLALSGVLLVGVGVFNEDFDPEHYVFSVSYFLTFLIALLVISASLYQTRVLGNFGLIVSSTACAIGVLLLPMGGNPESETIAVLTMIVWGALVSGAALLKEYGREIP